MAGQPAGRPVGHRNSIPATPVPFSRLSPFLRSARGKRTERSERASEMDVVSQGTPVPDRTDRPSVGQRRCSCAHDRRASRVIVNNVNSRARVPLLCPRGKPAGKNVESRGSETRRRRVGIEKQTVGLPVAARAATLLPARAVRVERSIRNLGM